MPGLFLYVNEAGKIEAASIVADNDSEERICEQLLNRMIQPDMLTDDQER